jgi:hypothetical protein
MVKGTDLAGIWAGTIVQGSNTAGVFVHLTVDGEAVAGSYEIPTAPSDFRTGEFTGTYSDASLAITVTGSNSAVHFDLSIVESNGEYMVFGHTMLNQPSPTLATVTLYKKTPLYRLISGAWIP